jgi:lipoprotein-anchoring transpeptidase ErfK/SrfK
VARQFWPVIALPFALAAFAGVLALQSLALGAPAPARDGPLAFAPARQARADAIPPTPVRPRRPAASLVAHVTGTVVVRTGPGGSAERVVGSRTEFGSPRTLGVVRRDGRWLGVTLPELGNGNLGWVDARAPGLVTGRTRVRLDVDLSARRLVLRRGRHVVRVVRVSIGRPGSPTPTGRFAVTDKLPGARYSAAYGCCILALSGRQPNVPAGWTGGDRLAIHGAAADEPIGAPASAGCLHAGERDLRRLMRAVPLGAPVVIRA